jgi:hypothetical protein
MAKARQDFDLPSYRPTNDPASRAIRAADGAYQAEVARLGSDHAWWFARSVYVQELGGVNSDIRCCFPRHR